MQVAGRLGGRQRLAESIFLREHVPTVDLRCVRAGHNEVWLTEGYVLRLSSGRFPGAYAHEARVIELLPESVPVAEVLASGETDGVEWMLSRKMPGSSLACVWPTLDDDSRRRAGHELGSIIKAFHATPTPPGFENPWLSRALTEPSRLRDAYHPPPWVHQRLLTAVSTLEGIDHEVLSTIADYIHARLPCFERTEKEVLTHCDLHFDNLLWDGTITAVLDLEGSRLAVADQELDTIVRFVQMPNGYIAHDCAVPDAAQLSGVLRDIGATYPELLDRPHLVPRLEVYEVLWFLIQLFHFPPTRRPNGPWQQLCDIARDGSRIVDAFNY